ncbi:MAG: NAD(P)H-dependent glycerol-3-phosphate dehydrogenase [Pseudomonadota bacterium]
MTFDFTADQLPQSSRAGIGRITVIGAGAWVTALAAIARSAGRDVSLWGRRADVLRDITEQNRSERYLPGVALPSGIRATEDIAEACRDTEGVLIVTPSRTLREICRTLKPVLPDDVPIALCCKGIERGTGFLMSQVAEAELPGHPIGALSGPTFARETALGHPTAATMAFPFTYQDRLHPEESAAARMAVAMGSETFRPYISDDLIGVEVGGAVKNVIAIACGMLTGAGFAENTRAALITRGMAEMKALAEALGGRRETVTGLSGAGDLTLTCSSQTSRNMSLGVQLGQGIPREQCFDGRPTVVEGEVNAQSVIELAQRIGVSMPICEAVYAILYNGAPLGDTFAELWSRPLRGERKGLDIEIDHPADASAISNLAERIS